MFLHEPHQALEIKRLRKTPDGTQLLSRLRGIRERRQYNDGNLSESRFSPLDGAEGSAIHDGHREVQENEARVEAVAERLQRLAAVPDAPRAETSSFQECDQRL